MASGEGYSKDELVFGARLLDITPTVLHYFGLPVGQDMEGRVLEKCFHPQPFRSDYAPVLANCQLQLKMLDEADMTIDQARDHFGRTENADLIKASIAIERENFATALELLEAVQGKLTIPGYRSGCCYVGRGEGAPSYVEEPA